MKEDATHKRGDTHKPYLLDLISPAYGDYSYAKSLSIIADEFECDFVAYYEVEWHRAYLELRSAHPSTYYADIVQKDLKHLHFGDAISGPSSLSASVLLQTQNAGELQFRILDDVHSIESLSEYSKVYEDIHSEVAIAIPQKFQDYSDPHPIGVLVLSSRKPRHFSEFENDPTLRTTIHYFSTTATWNILRRLEEAWKDIYQSIGRLANATDTFRFLEQVFNSLDTHVTHAVKYASMWAIGGPSDHPVLVREYMRDFAHGRSSSDECSVRIIRQAEGARHSLYTFLVESQERLNAGDTSEYFETREWRVGDPHFQVYMKDLFQTHFRLDSDDRVIVFPILSDFSSDSGATELEGELRKSPDLRGMMAVYTAKQSLPFIFDKRHVEKLSFAIGNGLERVLRNKRRQLSVRLAPHSQMVISTPNEFMAEAIRHLGELTPATYAGILLHNDAQGALEPIAEAIQRRIVQRGQLELAWDLRKDAGDPVVRTFLRPRATTGPYSCIDTPGAVDSAGGAVQDYCANCRLSMYLREVYGLQLACCILTPITVSDGDAIGLVVVANAGSGIGPAEGGDSGYFSREDARLVLHFADVMGTYLSIHEYHEAAQSTSVLQGHEIRQQARAIVSKSSQLKMFVAREWTGDQHLVPVRRIRELAESMSGSLNENLGAEIIVHCNSAIAEGAQRGLAPIQERISDIEKWGRNILFLTQLRTLLSMTRNELEPRTVMVGHDLLFNWRAVLGSDMSNDVKGFDIFVDPPYLRVHTDRAAMTMVIQNLVNNALNYSAYCTPITITATKRGSSAEVRFTNYGLGIPVEAIQLGQLWKEGWRGEEAKLVREQGTGIGLRVVHYITENLGLGSVTVSSMTISNRNIFLIDCMQRHLPSSVYAACNVVMAAEEQRLCDRAYAGRESIRQRIDDAFVKAIGSGRFADVSPRTWRQYVDEFGICRVSFVLRIANLSNPMEGES